MLELKDPEGLPRLARLIHERHLTRSVLVESNDPRVAAAAHEEGLLTAVWRSARQAAGDRPERWKDYVTMLSIDHRAAAGDVRRAVRSGIGYVWSHTVNTRGPPGTGCCGWAAKASSPTGRAAWRPPGWSRSGGGCRAGRPAAGDRRREFRAPCGPRRGAGFSPPRAAG